MIFIYLFISFNRPKQNGNIQKRTIKVITKGKKEVEENITGIKDKQSK